MVDFLLLNSDFYDLGKIEDFIHAKDEGPRFYRQDGILRVEGERQELLMIANAALHLSR